jgi:hypothetical protein
LDNPNVFLLPLKHNRKITGYPGEFNGNGEGAAVLRQSMINSLSAGTAPGCWENLKIAHL